MKKILKLIPIIAIIILGFVVRLYKIDNPIADWHSWRQADTASVTRVFSKEGINLLVPKFQDIGSTTTGKDNPEGFRMVEYPLYNFAHLAVFKLAPSLGIDKAGRLTSVFFSTISLIFLYLITRKISGEKTAILASFLFAFLPFSIYYSRVVLPEPAMITAYLISFYFFLKFIEKQIPSNFILSSLFMATAILIKPYAIFFILPYLYISLDKWGMELRKNKYFYIFIITSILPFAAWRIWILQFPEGIPGSSWLFNYMGIRFRPAWFRWLFGERLGHLILGIWGVVPFVLGVLKKPKSVKSASYLLWFFGIILYFSAIAGGNVTHDYYQAIIMPFVAMIMARGCIALTTLPTAKYHRFLSYLAVIFIIIFSLGYSWYQIRGYYQINNPAIIEAGKKADEILPSDALVVAPYNGDTAFLYQTNRYGWSVIQSGDIKIMVDHQKATHYVSTTYDQKTVDILGTGEFETLVKTDNYVIVKLRYPNK
jgi:hypothetical protein